MGVWLEDMIEVTFGHESKYNECDERELHERQKQCGRELDSV